MVAPKKKRALVTRSRTCGLEVKSLALFTAELYELEKVEKERFALPASRICSERAVLLRYFPKEEKEEATDSRARNIEFERRQKEQMVGKRDSNSCSSLRGAKRSPMKASIPWLPQKRKNDGARSRDSNPAPRDCPALCTAELYEPKDEAVAQRPTFARREKHENRLRRALRHQTARAVHCGAIATLLESLCRSLGPI